MQMDASRQCSVCYALLQDQGGGNLRLVQRDSRFLTDTVNRYATIGLKELAGA